LTSIGATGGITDGWNCPSELGSGAPSAACEFDGRFPAGGSTTFTVTAAIDPNTSPDTELENTAALSWTDSRGNHESDDNAAVEVSTRADIAALKTAMTVEGEETDTFTPGERALYEITVGNEGPS